MHLLMRESSNNRYISLYYYYTRESVEKGALSLSLGITIAQKVCGRVQRPPPPLSLLLWMGSPRAGEWHTQDTGRNH